MYNIVADSSKLIGEVPEWLKGLVLKTSVPATVPWVRIPPSPPDLLLALWRSTQVAEGDGLLNR